MSILQKLSLFIASLLVTLWGTGAMAQNSPTATQLDPGVSLSLDLNERVRLNFFSGREKNEELESGKWRISGGVSFRTKPLFKRFLDELDTDKRHVLVLGIGYEFAHGSQAQVTSKEHKIMLDATLRWAFKGKFLLSNRNRFELRWVSDDTHFRIREDLRLERPIRIPIRLLKRKITPFGKAEAFWDHRYKEWNIFRYGGGLEIPVLRRASLDVSYERMHCVTCADTNTNIFKLTLNFYFRLKKK